MTEDSRGAVGGTTADFVKEADAICAKSRRRMEKGLRPVTRVSLSDARVAAIYQRALTNVIKPEFEAQSRELSQLRPPPAMDEQMDRLVRALDAVAQRAKRGIKRFTKEYPYAATEELSDELGLKECGRP